MSPAASRFWRQVRRNWQFGACFVTALLYTVVFVTDQVASRGLTAIVSSVAESGGGVLAVVSPMDCIALDEVLDEVAGGLRVQNVSVEGLVIADDLVNEAEFLVGRNEKWPHRAVSLRSVYDVVSRTGTPIVLAVTGEGRIALIERIDRGDPSLVSRLAGVVR